MQRRNHNRRVFFNNASIVDLKWVSPPSPEPTKKQLLFLSVVDEKYSNFPQKRLLETIQKD
jgi:hypothetical protein